MMLERKPETLQAVRVAFSPAKDRRD
jgi:hypothetical protein